MKFPVQRIIDRGLPCLFISPHLDDAIFSAGGLLAYLAPRTPVLLATVFTEVSPPPYGRVARRFLADCGYDDADELFRDRAAEDRRVGAQLGAEIEHLGFVDAAWRRPALTSRFRQRLARLLPEAQYVYPFTCVSGFVSPHDRHLQHLLGSRLAALWPQHKLSERVVFCPAAIGAHVDHVVTRNACLRSHGEAILWADFPYSERSKAGSRAFKPSGRRACSWAQQLDRKRDLVMYYESQVRCLFGSRPVSLAPETYYLSQGALK